MKKFSLVLAALLVGGSLLAIDLPTPDTGKVDYGNIPLAEVYSKNKKAFEQAREEKSIEAVMTDAAINITTPIAQFAGAVVADVEKLVGIESSSATPSSSLPAESSNDSQGIVVKGKVITESTVSGNVDVSGKSTLNVGGITITGNNSEIGEAATIRSTTKIKDATLSNGSKANIGNVDIINTKVKSGTVESFVDSSQGTIILDKAKLNMGNVTLQSKHEMNGGTIKSEVYNNKEIKGGDGGRIDIGNISVKDTAISGETTEIRSLVTNNGTIESKGKNSTISTGEETKVEIGNINILGGSVDTGAHVLSTATNGGTVGAYEGSTVRMGNIQLTGAKVSGANALVSSTVTVNSGASVKAKTGSSANFGNIQVGGATPKK